MAFVFLTFFFFFLLRLLLFFKFDFYCSPSHSLSVSRNSNGVGSRRSPTPTVLEDQRVAALVACQLSREETARPEIMDSGAAAFIVELGLEALGLAAVRPSDDSDDGGGSDGSDSCSGSGSDGARGGDNGRRELRAVARRAASGSRYPRAPWARVNPAGVDSDTLIVATRAIRSLSGRCGTTTFFFFFFFFFFF
jgi:hypothetical protein